MNYCFFIVELAEGYFDDWSQERLLNRFLEQVGTRVPEEKCRKEFIPTMGGNFITYDTTRRPRQLEEPTDNGIAFAANGFNWPKKRDITWTIYSDFPAFFSLIKKAGLLDEIWWEFNFLNFSEFHTVFAPTDNALSGVNTDTLSIEELERFIKYHFVSGDIIFTDGQKTEKEYPTLCPDESASAYEYGVLSLGIRPDPGLISISDNAGNPLCEVSELDSKTNMVFGRTQETYKTMGVIHAIDTVLVHAGVQ